MTSQHQYTLSQLQILEAESIHIIREVVAQMERPAPVSYTHLTLPTNREV